MQSDILRFSKILRLAFVAAISALTILPSGCGYLNSLSEITKFPIHGEQVSASEDIAPTLRVEELALNTSAKGLSNASQSDIAAFDYSKIDFQKPNTAVVHSVTSGSFNGGPIVDRNSLFLMDQHGIIRCYDSRTLTAKWTNKILCKSAEGCLTNLYLNGGIGSDSQALYIVADMDFVAKISKQTGKVMWKKNVSSLLHDRPIVVGNKVIVQGTSGSIYALSTETGDLQWVQHHAQMTPFPAYGIIANRLLVFVDDKGKQLLLWQKIPSCELSIVDLETGGLQVGKAVTQPPMSHGTTLTNSANIFAPLVDQKRGYVYFSYNDGTVNALSMKKFENMWSRKLFAIRDFWLYKNYLYTINIYNQLLMVNVDNGKIAGILSLDDFESLKEASTRSAATNPIYQSKSVKHVQQLDKVPKFKFGKEYASWTSPIVAGGVICTIRNDGLMLMLNPLDFKVIKRIKIRSNIQLQPTFANGAMYALTAEGRILRYAP